MRILLFEGGKSTEHEVSIESAAYIRRTLQSMGHSVRTIHISHEGEFTLKDKEVFFSPVRGFFTAEGAIEADVAFPVMHGYSGEDGILQSLLCLSGIPYVSETPLTSEIGMHKRTQNQLLTGIVPLLGYENVPVRSADISTAERLIRKLGSCLVTKPEDGGSSVGVIASESFTEETLLEAIKASGRFSESVIVQHYLPHVREIEVFAYADYREEKLNLLSPVEIVTESTLLDYDSKYSSGSHVLTGDEVKLTREEKECIRGYAEKVFRAISGSMYMRIDFFYKDGQIFFNEVNTIPGMTEFSHVPAAVRNETTMEAVLSTLLENALIRHEREEKIVHRL